MYLSEPDRMKLVADKSTNVIDEVSFALPQIPARSSASVNLTIELKQGTLNNLAQVGTFELPIKFKPYAASSNEEMESNQ